MDHKETNNRLHLQIIIRLFSTIQVSIFAHGISKEKLISINDIEIEVSGYGPSDQKS